VAQPAIGDAEIANVTDALRRGALSGTLSGDYLGEFERLVAASCECAHGVAVTSGTTALALAVAVSGIGHGDEVLVPSFTNVATAFAVVYAGARPVFVDADPRTWNVDVDAAERAVSERTRAIMPVHIYGHPVDMDQVMALAERHRLEVIEDVAEAHGAECRGRRTGSFGQAGALSFYANKIVTTGEGGMVVTNDPERAARARRLRNLAYSDRDRFQHEEIGFNYRMTNVQAAIGVAQMSRFDGIVERKRQVAARYAERLAGSGLRLPVEMPWAKSVFWVYGVVLEEGMPDRDAVRQRLLDDGVETRPFFTPMHRQPVFRSLGLGDGGIDLPVSAALGDRGLYLPSGIGLTETEIDLVADRLLAAIRA
jgi:perosamine synthetase